MVVRKQSSQTADAELKRSTIMCFTLNSVQQKFGECWMRSTFFVAGPTSFMQIAFLDLND
jgi:hypothetical protein